MQGLQARTARTSEYEQVRATSKDVQVWARNSKDEIEINIDA